jgi:hypothetical protein
MKELREKISGSLTGGAAPKTVVRSSVLLGAAATLSALPYFHFLVFHASRGDARGGDPWSLLAGQAALLLLLSVLSAMVGLSFAPRLGLPGLGDPARLREEWKGLVLVGAVLGAVSFILFDQWFARVSPGAYPQGPLLLLSIPFKTATTEEVILRLCMVTVAVGLFRRTWAGVLVVALAAPLLAFKSFRFLGLEEVSHALLGVQLLLSLLSNLALGIVFVSRGLLSCLVVKFVFGLKYVAVAWLVL